MIHFETAETESLEKSLYFNSIYFLPYNNCKKTIEIECRIITSFYLRPAQTLNNVKILPNPIPSTTIRTLFVYNYDVTRSDEIPNARKCFHESRSKIVIRYYSKFHQIILNLIIKIKVLIQILIKKAHFNIIGQSH